MGLWSWSSTCLFLWLLIDKRVRYSTLGKVVSMRKVLLLANIQSPHLEYWLTILRNRDVRIFTCHGNGNSKFETLTSQQVEQVLPGVMNSLGLITYAIAAVAFRIRFGLRHRHFLLHAHSASGYGTMALLSGLPYVVTTYGSEVYEVNKRNFIYRWWIKQVLSRAEIITTSSESMRHFVIDELNISPTKILTFALPVDQDVFHTISVAEKSELRKTLGFTSTITIWVVNRRVRELYCTKDVIEGFLNFCDLGVTGIHLVVLCGDYDFDYLTLVEKLVYQSVHKDKITLIREFLNKEKLAKYLKVSDFTLSVPKTDQLSMSILEAASCGSLMVLSPISAYEELFSKSLGYRCSGFRAKDFRMCFETTYQYDAEKINREKNNQINIIDKHYSISNALSNIESLYSATVE